MPFQLELPDLGEGVVEAEVQKWFVAPGDRVAEDQPLVEVTTDKATVVIPSPRAGRVVRLCCAAGEIAKVHAPLVELELELEGAGGGPGGPPPGAEPVSARKALAAPAVRALARELGVAIDTVAGTGPGGRVMKEDLAALRAPRRNGHAPGANGTAAPSGGGPAIPLPRLVPGEKGRPTPTSTATSTATATGRASATPSDERIPLRGVRKKIAENMARSKRTAAHFTFVEQCDVTELVRAKERMAAAAAAEGVKLSFLPFVMKAAVAALRKHPSLNATMDEERAELVVHRRYDLGVASSSEAGLIVPVVRAVEGRSLLELAREIERLAADTKAGRVRPEDLGRSTFTVTSLGKLGGLFATPVLNHPEVAILGIHRIRPTPVVRDGAVVVRDVMHVSVTCDHRVIDGHEAAAFGYEVIRALEQPELIFMRMA